MRSAFSLWSLLLVIAVAPGGNPPARPNPAGRGVAYFEPPRSIGTPIDEVARNYTGPGLADRIAGRLRLDTDGSLHPVTRELIRRRLAQQS